MQPDNSNEARMLRMKASSFTMIDDILFKKSTTDLLQRCLERDETDIVLRDIHKGDCGNHTSGRNLSLKILRTGNYRPILRHDALEYCREDATRPWSKGIYVVND